jgi:hypothetical protein
LGAGWAAATRLTGDVKAPGHDCDKKCGADSNRTRKGDFVIWDNCGCMHLIVLYDEGSGRKMHRTSIMDEERVA